MSDVVRDIIYSVALPALEWWGRRCWLFAKVVIISSEKPQRVVSEGLWVFRAPQRHFDYALGNHFPHRAGVGRPSDAWDRIEKSDSRFAGPSSRAMREVIAKRIIEMAQRAAKDPQTLADDAVRFFAANYYDLSKQPA